MRVVALPGEILSHLEHDLHNFACVVRSIRLASFSSSSRNSCWTVSIASPRNSSVVLGPACFSGVTIPQALYRLFVGYGDSWHIAQSWGDQEL